MSVSTQISIYQINVNQDETPSEVIEKIVTEISHEVHELEPSLDLNLNKYSCRIFTWYSQDDAPWAEFLTNFVAEFENIPSFQNTRHSFLCFLFKGKRLYCIAAGSGASAIRAMIIPDFGIQVLSRLLDEGTDVIGYVEDRIVSGNVILSARQFRSNSKPSDISPMGHLPKNIKANLAKAQSYGKIGVTDAQAGTRLNCEAKSSFQLKKSLNAQQAVDLITNIQQVLTMPASVELSSLRRLNAQNIADQSVINAVKSQLKIEIFKAYKSQREALANYDLCHDDNFDYLGCTTYLLKKDDRNYEFSSRPFLLEVLEKLDSWGELNKKNAVDMWKSLELSTLAGVNEDGDSATHDTVANHIGGETVVNGTTYLCVDGAWYIATANFLDNLNSQFALLADECLTSKIAQIAWGGAKNEDIYNAKYLGNEHLVLHKVLFEKIELCDFLVENDGKVHLVHVKKGFGCSVRDLAYQVEICCRRVIDSFYDSDKLFLNGVYASLASKASSNDVYFKKIAQQTKAFPLALFLKLFETRRKISACIAIYDDSVANRSLSDPTRFESNIAKFALVDLHNKLRSLGIDLSLVEIKR